MTETDPLLAAVEALTQPVIEHIAQRTDTGKWIRTHTIEHPPLLVQMREAVWPSTGNDGTSKSSPQERSVVDVNMLFEYRKIASEIGDWVRLAHGVATSDPITNLTMWARLTMNTDVPAPYLRTLHGWAYAIRRMLDKPAAFTITGACPVCGATEWGNMLDGGGMHVLKVEYRLDKDDHPTDVTAICQACRIVWEGRAAVEELAEELSEAS